MLGECLALKWYTRTENAKEWLSVNVNISIVAELICGQSYKQFTLVIYDSTVVIWGIFKSGTTLES